MIVYKTGKLKFPDIGLYEAWYLFGFILLYKKIYK